MDHPIHQKEQVSIAKFIDSEVRIDNHQVINNLNFEINKGDFIFLIGQTGSGKSTLMRLLYGDLPINKGTASVVGFDLKKIKTRDIPRLRRKLGIVFQDFKLLNDRNIYENLAFVLKATGWKSKKKIKKRVFQTLKLVNVHVDTKKYPIELSGGEQQRVAIARAILNEPQLIIADEPTGNLDPSTSLELMRLFEMLHRKGMTILMSTHNYNMVLKFPGKIYRLENKALEEVIRRRVQKKPMD
ncbi:MAG: ATP-binding cassette domain-containing protein [Flavobacteriaceae bacterium]|nr:ATP-binding cassette domain-containing protein [Flavobacteriaceae bacterium]MCY4267126.1 ATP-binding cassette domain-containing protein [Flavobacteriaceae bacterium]MCY4299908.1 ATP-binding cassette domain-containing protein [Flavobacteriaceae bacterium]